MDDHIEDDDDIFFGLPEDDIDFSEVDFIWDRHQSEKDRTNAHGVDAAASTEAGKRGKRKKSKPSSSRSKKAAEKAPRLQCNHCSKTYANERTLQTHKNSVFLKDLACRAPNVDDLLEHIKDLSVAALLEVEQKFTVGELAVNCASYAKRLAIFIMQCDASSLMEFLAKTLIESFKFEDVVFLPKLRETVNRETNRLLNTPEFRSRVKNLCNEFIECPNNVLNFFLGNFILFLSNKVLIYACQAMHQKAQEISGPRMRSNDDFTSLKFKRIVHYIGGSVVCGINRRRRNYPSATHIQNFASLLNVTFVEDKDDESTWCEPEVKSWTMKQDRGGLCHVSKNAFNFFLELVMLAMCHEEDDGSVIIEKVNRSVSQHVKLLEMWDVLVGVFIEEDQSLEWLASIVEIVCRCVSKGVIKRRLNDALKKPVSNVAHRPKLAR